MQAGVPNPQTGRALINITGASPFLQLSADGVLICIQPMVPVTAAGVIDCDGGTNLGATLRQDHRLGTVGTGGFTAQNCTNAGGTVEGAVFPHENVCNGPLTLQSSAAGDSGPGAVAISPDPTFGTVGLPARLTFESGAQCTGVSNDALEAVFVLLSSDTRTEVLHVDNTADTLVYDNPGENFSCPAWNQENGPGNLILAFPTLHGSVIATDLINVFVFDD